MYFKRALAIALTLAAVVPATAAAQLQIAPPDGDNYLGPIFMSDESNPFPSDEVGFIADTSAYTVQADMYSPPQSGGPMEPVNCGTAYGNTVWSVFYANRYGVMNVSTAGPFDAVIGVVPFTSPDDPAPNLNAGYCDDGLSGFQEDTSFFVSPRHWYAVQVGGTGTPQGGQVQVKFKLNKPPAVDGQAFLFWKTGPLRVTQLYAKNVPKGEKLTLSCTKGACRKKSVTAKKPSLLERPLGENAGEAPFGLRMKGATGSSSALPASKVLRPTAQAAAKRVNLLKNARVKRGAKIVLRITAPGYIGKYFVWKAGRNNVSSATVRCMNPGSTKPRKKCSG
jgi:hypothetical protein